MRKFSLILIALGAFLVVLGPMMKSYAYPRIAVAPANKIAHTGLFAKDAVVFDIATLKPITTDLTTEVRTVGDASTPAKCPGDVTYINSTSTVSGDGVMRSRQVERMTLDERTAMPDSKCGKDFISTTEGVETPVVATGLQAKFPFNTQKHAYPFWDSTLAKSFPAEYRGTTDYQGLHLYKFVQDVPRSQYTTMDLPGTVLGLATGDTVTAQAMYSNRRTFLVEPETGLIFQRQESLDQALDYQGQERVTLTKTNVAYDAATIRQNVKDGSKGGMLHMMRSTLPAASFVLGLVMIIAGIILGRRKPRTTDASSKEARDFADASV